MDDEYTQYDMKRARFRFYAELNDFLPRIRRGLETEYAFRGDPSIKDAIEAQGVPHTEVDLVLADGEPVDFGWTLRDGARVSVYPVFESLDVSTVSRVRPVPLRDVRFVLDGHLGRLARYLRMAGFDASWRNDADDQALAGTAACEHRIVLTRDRGLLKRRAVTHGHCVRETEPLRQLAEVIRRFDLARAIAPFRRCVRCNVLLEPIAKDAVTEVVPQPVRERQDAYRRCPACGRVYWQGTHVSRMERILAGAINAARSSPPVAG